MVSIELILQVIPVLSLSVAIVYYAVNVRNQNKTAQAGNFMQMHNHWLSTSRDISVTRAQLGFKTLYTAHLDILQRTEVNVL